MAIAVHPVRRAVRRQHTPGGRTAASWRT